MPVPGPQPDGHFLPSVILRVYDAAMASTPIKREKQEKDLLHGQTTATETELKPKRTKEQNRSRERMLELVERRRQLAAEGRLKRTGRARTKFSKEEKEAAALARLMPRALKVLEEQLDDEDPRVRQSAAVKIFEYVKGKPSQTIKQDVNQVTAIRFETVAFGAALPELPVASAPLLLEDGEDDVIEVEVTDAD